jgi:hypothetical protein
MKCSSRFSLFIAAALFTACASEALTDDSSSSDEELRRRRRGGGQTPPSPDAGTIDAATPPPPPPPPQSGSAAAGTARFVAYLTSDSGFLPFIDAPNAQQQAFMRTHYSRMFAFAPYFDSRLSWSSPAWVYKDSYAIYPGSAGADDMAVSNAASYILRDGGGNWLYIPYACGGGTCSQYAADVGNPAFRALWIAQAKRVVARGYGGIHVDDVNLDWRIGDGNGNQVTPMDPRTGALMTLSNWRKYMAEFMEEVRAAFPTQEIVHNSLWFVSDSDPYVQRQLKAASIVNFERGVIDDGITGGNGQYGYDTFLSYIDRLHAHGTGSLFFGYGTTEGECEYNEASYFLVSDGSDGLTCLYRNKPNDWWAGYDASLGAPLGPRTRLASGVLSREFEKGRVVVAPPGLAQAQVDLGGNYVTVRGETVSSVTLRAKAGLVLRKP